MARDDGGAAATVITAFVLGALTGAAVALLLAYRVTSALTKRRIEQEPDPTRT